MSKCVWKYEYYDEEKTKIKSKELFNEENDDCGESYDHPVRIRYHENGNKKSEYWSYSIKCFCRLDGPSTIRYDENGEITSELYQLHTNYNTPLTKETYYEQPEVQEYLKQKAFDQTILEILND